MTPTDVSCRMAESIAAQTCCYRIVFTLALDTQLFTNCLILRYSWTSAVLSWCPYTYVCGWNNLLANVTRLQIKFRIDRYTSMNIPKPRMWLRKSSRRRHQRNILTATSSTCKARDNHVSTTCRMPESMLSSRKFACYLSEVTSKANTSYTEKYRIYVCFLEVTSYIVFDGVYVFAPSEYLWWIFDWPRQRKCFHHPIHYENLKYCSQHLVIRRTLV